MNSIRKRLTYANVAATLALLFAMSGGALAANHFLINSTKQINPKVLKKLKGNRGARGATGAPGAPGAKGATGATGATGSTGPTGPKGSTGSQGFEGERGVSATEPLPSGESESGQWGIGYTGGTTGEFVSDAVSFPVPLLERAEASHVKFTTTTAPTTECPGPGSAARGFVCIYTFNIQKLEPPTTFGVEGAAAEPGTDRFGFIMEWKVTGAHPFAWGTYTVTAG
jgi:hypothetical protein